ncbi:DNA repair family protein [Aspergillus bombycis]|uniref:DNA repair family protein n=1 Tax=Aspergillus bombycis TaxID=109264 RepID=A0A1F8AAA2_9EURO|nr:DNA repair family protein [Aspergillus bombycis]OGM48319.1 DNA repair family protein [Aspergillus bombycis]
MSKRIQSFFQPIPKKPKVEPSSPDPSQPSNALDIEQEQEEQHEEEQQLPLTHHPAYPFPIPNLPPHLSKALSNISSTPKPITNHPHLDLLYFQPLLPPQTAHYLFHFLRSSLPFYKVQYTIHRGQTPTKITTPRNTTVFGVDATSTFTHDEGNKSLLCTKTNTPPPSPRYKCHPRPIPPCLEHLRQTIQSVTNTPPDYYNFILVNYYASNTDSISYHSDDERFLGPNPSIASLSLGAKRDFLLKHKPGIQAGPLKFPLASGDMVVMRGETQANWLHSVPKRAGDGGGRINVTFRRALVPGGTENYYRYNVGDGGVWRWDGDRGSMVLVGGEESSG